jgi:hypothetical protein
VKRVRGFVLLILLVFCCGRLLAQGNDPVVRLSYVQGKVQILQDQTTQFDQAQANMPVMAGERLETGADGQAEIEFEDGSVARLTPNSSLQILRLPDRGQRNGSTEVQQLAGLAYFELNISEGQRYTVRFAGATARPTDNSIFRIDLDNTPELATIEGAVYVSGGLGFEENVPAKQTIHLTGPSGYTLSADVRSESWDRWNAERDQEIARLAENQTEARNQSDNGTGPGWDELDYYGNWYPVEGYGNVWTPGYAGGFFDPYANGYWASYPGWGYTWISAYPWGWLPYHCGAWNYFDQMGWGWIAGGCGLGWAPVGAIWNAPPGFRLPPKPVLNGHMGPPRLVPVNRGSESAQHFRAEHTKPIRLDGQTVSPLPVVRNPWLLQHGEGAGRLTSGDGHVGVPVGSSRGSVTGSVSGSALRPGAPTPTGPARPDRPVNTRSTVDQPRPTYTPRPVAPPPMAAPRPMAPAPVAPPPAPSRPISPPMAPAPHMSAPAPSPHAAAPAGPPANSPR